MRRLVALAVTTLMLAVGLLAAASPATAKRKPKPGWWCDKHSSQPIKWCAPIVRPIPPRKF